MNRKIHALLAATLFALLTLTAPAQIISPFQYGIFYQGPLEFSDTATMSVNGAVHCNSNICVGAGSGATLTFRAPVTSVGILTAPSRNSKSWTLPDTYDASNWRTYFTNGGTYTTNVEPLFTYPGLTNKHMVIDLPPSTESLSTVVAQTRLYNLAQVRLIVSNNAVWLKLQVPPSAGQLPAADPSPITLTYTNFSDFATNLPFLTLTNIFYDAREGRTNLVTQIDVGRYRNWLLTNNTVISKFPTGGAVTNYPTILYVVDNRTTNKLAVVRLTNGLALPNNGSLGWSVATPNPLYVWGNYNCTNISYLATSNTTATVPAALMCDALTILSTKWSDTNSLRGIYSSGNTNYNAAPTNTINAALLVGNVPSTGTSSTTFSGGVHNLPRLLEDWSSSHLWLNTSIVCLYQSTRASNQWKYQGTYYNPPIRHFSGDPKLMTSPTNNPGYPLPPGSPIFISGPTITTQPQGQAAIRGSNAIFFVTASGPYPPYTYQWRFNGANIVGATLSNLVVGAQNSTVGNYSVKVIDAYLASTISSNAKLTILSNIVPNLPASVAEGAGTLANAGSITLPNPLSHSYTVKLSVDNPYRLIIPTNITIPLGQTNVWFDLTVVDDQLPFDGRYGFSTQVIVTASGPGISSTNKTLPIIDNDPTVLETSTIPSPQTPGVPFTATVIARNAFNELITNLTQQINVSAHAIDDNDQPGYITISPAQITLTNGQWTGEFTVSDSYYEVEIYLDYPTQSGGYSTSVHGHFNPIDVGYSSPGVDHFSWSSVGAIQAVDGPFFVILKAIDINNHIVVNFTNTVALSALGANGNLVLSPTNTTGFTAGRWWGYATFGSADSNVVLTATDDNGHIGSSNPFRVVGNTPDHITWGSLNSIQHAGVPFNITLNMKDELNRTVTNFSGTVSLSASGDEGSVDIFPTETAAFTNGFWTGLLTANTISSNVVMVADDGNGHTGLSGSFNTLSNEPPVILIQPADVTVTNGFNATFTVTASGTGPLRYQWRFDGNDIANATNATLTLIQVLTNQAGLYSVTVTNYAGSATSSSALLNVVPDMPPTISVQPADVTVSNGSPTTFTVTVDGTQPLRYQWHFNGGDITNATNATLTLFQVLTAQAGFYSVTVTNAVGSATSSNALLTVVASPCLVPPAGLVSLWRGESDALDAQSTHDGSSLNGTGFATGMVGQAFQFDGVNDVVRVPSTTGFSTTNYTIEAWINPAAQPNNPENQCVVAAQGNGFCQLLLRKGTTGVYAALQFKVGGSFLFAVSSNQLPLGQFSHLAGTWDGTTLRIYVNGALAGQSTWANTTPANSGCPFFIGGFHETAGGCAYTGQYFSGLIDEVSFYNRALSSNEIQAVCLSGSSGKCPGIPPQISTQPADLTVPAGATATFTAAATGSDPLAYQWLLNGTNITDATNRSLALNPVTTDHAGTYSLLVTNAYGSATSSNAILTVYAPYPGEISSPAYDSLTGFNFEVTGEPGVSYTVEASTNLLNWTPIITNLSPFFFTDPDTAGYPMKFYRTFQVP